MFFGKKSLPHPFALIDAMGEAACLFSSKGDLCHRNMAAQKLFLAAGFPAGQGGDLASFHHMLAPFRGRGDDTRITIAGESYACEGRDVDGGHLVRFVPLTARDHAMRLSASLDCIPWGVLTCDLSDAARPVLFCNSCAGKFMDIAPSAMTGQSLYDVFHVFGVEEDLRPYLASVETTHFDFHKKNDSVWYRLHFIPYRCDGHYCLVVVEDTTDLKMREGKSFQAQRLEALGQLAGGVAHDFNNILSIIDGYARMGRNALPDSAEAGNCLDRITQAVERGSSITTHLLTFGDHKVDRNSVCDLGRLLKDQQAMLRPLLDAMIDFSVHAEEGLYVDVPEADLSQILLNLCINARDAMPGGGQLLVEAGRRNEGAIFMRVIDTGCGMTPDVRARMFDPFFTTKDQGKGTGLGLSMVYGMVKDRMGEIDVVTRVGEGTSMTILFPASTALPGPDTSHAGAVEDVSLQGCTVLVAEDEPDLLDILSAMLSAMGVRILRARNGNEALMVQDEYDGDIDFLVTDVVMPELNGVKMAELFSSVRPETRILFMSGYPANGQMARVEIPDNAILLPKPVQADTIAHVLKTMLLPPKDRRGAPVTPATRWRIA